jgi:hypothetical protein
MDCLPASSFGISPIDVIISKAIAGESSPCPYFAPFPVFRALSSIPG